MEENKPRKYSHSIMTKNVTEFRHLIKNPCATENDVTWAINLRQYSRSPSKAYKDGTVPQVYHKKTKISQIRQKQFLSGKNKEFSPFKCNQYSHMIPKFNEKTLKQSQTAIQFYSSLRKYGKEQDKQNREKFSTIPFKEKHQQPKILKKVILDLKKMYMKKTKNLTKEDFQNTFDGMQNYPEYSQKILRSKNYGLLKSFTQVRGRGQVSLPGLAWQIGLRNY